MSCVVLPTSFFCVDVITAVRYRCRAPLSPPISLETSKSYRRVLKSLSPLIPFSCVIIFFVRQHRYRASLSFFGVNIVIVQIVVAGQYHWRCQYGAHYLGFLIICVDDLERSTLKLMLHIFFVSVGMMISDVFVVIAANIVHKSFFFFSWWSFLPSDNVHHGLQRFSLLNIPPHKKKETQGKPKREMNKRRNLCANSKIPSCTRLVFASQDAWEYVHNSYGLLRTPWNSDPTPYVTRHNVTNNEVREGRGGVVRLQIR